jgi:hypothetical protein
MGRTSRWTWRLALVLAVALRAAAADVGAESRSAADVFERKPTLRDALVFVASDLAARHARDRATAPAVLLLVVDPTASMRAEVVAIAAALDDVWKAGPDGLRVGVHGAGAESVAPTRMQATVASALQGFARLPADGPKNLHDAVRRAARSLEKEAGPRAVVLVTRDGGDAEDDVEETREALFESGVVFYAVAPEAAFERAWEYDFEANVLPDAGLTERFVPEPTRKTRDTFYVGGDVAFGLVPYAWEFSLAQTTFRWERPPDWPVPSGFGYWNLATLCFSTGGRYFVFDYEAAARAAAARKAPDVRKTLYDYARLRLLAPDLRPREKVLKDLDRDPRAGAILRIWQLLADDANPILQDLPTLEARGTSLVARPARPVRSAWTPPYWIEDEDQVKKVLEVANARVAALERALSIWASANAKDRTVPAGAPETLAERVEADFQLLGVQLRKAYFGWEEYRATLREIRPLDLSYRRVRIEPVVLATGARRPERPVRLPDEHRAARLADLFAAQERVAAKYPGTPWSLVLEKGYVVSFRKDVRVIEPEGDPDRRDPRGGKPAPSSKDPPPPPPAPPPPGARPGSGGSGPVTGG